MPKLFFRSAGLHFAWFVRSWMPRAHPDAPLGPRRVFFLLVLFPLFCAVQLGHWAGFLLDECFFRDYRKIRIEKPVFISGIPRSGTTFVHRVLADRSDNFTTPTTWEVLLAPSITQRKLLRALAALDRALGSFLRRGLGALFARTAGDFHAIHKVDPFAPEEDYLALLPAAGCFLLCFAFPFSTRLRSLGKADRLSSAARDELLLFYHRVLQKHLYCAPAGTRLLSKNAAFASWLPGLREHFPDAGFLVCVREPRSALSSQLSALTGARQLFGTDPDGGSTARLMTETFKVGYGELRRFLEQAEPASVALIDQADLRSAPGPLLAAAAERLGLDPSGGLAARLAEIPPGPESRHRHDSSGHAIDAEPIDLYLEPEYRRMLSGGARVTRRTQ